MNISERVLSGNQANVSAPLHGRHHESRHVDNNGVDTCFTLHMHVHKIVSSHIYKK